MDNMDYNMYNSNDNDKKENTAEIQVLESAGTTSFYSESYRKPKQKRNISLVQLIAIALISSIFGGGVVFAAFQFVAPALQPTVSGYLGNLIPSSQTAVTNKNDSTVYKKVEIEKSTSAVTAIAEKVSPSVVGIKVTTRVQNYFFGTSIGEGQGSGIIIRNDGLIMTNNHVIESAIATGNTLQNGAKIEVYLPSQPEKPYQATVVGRDSQTDLAVIKINATGLPVAELGDSDKLKVGELAVAIGNPGGLEYMGSVTAGVISGLNRPVSVSDSRTMKLIQTDAAINPGNSGGALINSEGQVIGVNSIKFATQGFEGMGFAIPINQAKEITDSLIQYQYVKGRPKLGVYIEPNFNEAIAKQNNVPAGLLVYDVEPLSAAYKAGIQKYDIITKVDGQQVKTFNELQTLKNKHKPGDSITIEVYRDGKTITVTAVLTEDTSGN